MRQSGIALLGILFLQMVIGGCSASDQSHQSETSANEDTEAAASRPVTLADLEAKQSEYSVEVMTRDDYPDTYAKLGEDAFDRANELAKWAGIVAAESPSCDRVDIIAVSDRSTRSELQWYVDCVNGERFRPTESQAREARARWQDAKGKSVPVNEAVRPQSAALANIGEVDAVTMCDQAVREAMKAKGSFDTAGSWQFRQHPAEGRVSVTREFEAQNAFGATLSSEYRCLIDAASRSFIEIAVREPTGWEIIHPR